MNVDPAPGRVGETVTDERIDAATVRRLAGAGARQPLPDHEGKSGAPVERVTADGVTAIVKTFDPERDWIARSTGELRSRHVRLWEAGVLDRLPDCLDHVTLGCVEERLRGRAAIVMRDVSPWVVPPGASSLAQTQHHQFVGDLASLHAAFWGCEDQIGLLPLANRYLVLSPWTARGEAAHPQPHPIPAQLIPEGWNRLPEKAPSAGPVALRLIDDLGPLLEGLAGTPHTLLHGDWKIANLGTGPDGRTIVLDWDLCGVGPACADLAWHLAINGRELPESKEATIDAYREALEARGVDTTGWWERQLDLCLIGAFLQLGWSLVVTESPEIDWWDRRVALAAASLS